MSAIAGIVHFDGRPARRADVTRMTAAMGHRGPHGIHHWAGGSAALGQCVLRTTPESALEALPLANEDGSLVLVMDGRVDNREELRRALLARGCTLRSPCDAELVLRSYEAWGAQCTQRVIGELVFFIWDARAQRLFAGRDAAGTRYCHYVQGEGWIAFASEARALFALPEIAPRINEARVIDYLANLFEREDQVSTFYAGVLRLPAGHAMEVTAGRLRVWRWWDPCQLTASRFGSVDECAEAFMAQLRVAVQARLRSTGPVGAMLSGGLDSSTVAALASQELKAAGAQPLQTFSLIRSDSEDCPDWAGIQAVISADPRLRPTVLSASLADDMWPSILLRAAHESSPYALTLGHTYRLMYEAAHAGGCPVVLDGMAGDSLFYSPWDSLGEVVRRRLYRKVLPALRAYRFHGMDGAKRAAALAAAAHLAPDVLRTLGRRLRDARQVRRGGLQMLQPARARQYLRARRSAGYLNGERSGAGDDGLAHAGLFKTGAISFAHEIYGDAAFDNGVEPRSPFSDRRVIEFALSMPLEAKLSLPCYKHLLRRGTAAFLPDAVRGRRDIGSHPGWPLLQRLMRNLASSAPAIWNGQEDAKALERWLDPQAVQAHRRLYARTGDSHAGSLTFTVVMLSQWALSALPEPAL